MSDYSRLIEIFKKLVAFRTVTGDQDAAADCLNQIEQMLAPYGLYINRYSSNGFESLVATTRPTKTPKLLLQAHLDVVPGDDALFELRREDNKLLGRGAFDMKYAAACFLRLVEEHGAGCAEYDFGLMFTMDEELDGQNGTKYLLDQGFGGDVCLLPDGGDNWRVETAAKGAWMVDATVRGRSAHGSRPWDGDNAADKLVTFLQAASSLAPLTSHTDTTMVVSRLQAGSAYNQVPDEACASFDIRYLNSTGYVDITERLSALAKTHGVQLTTQRMINPIQLDVNLPAVQEWERIVSEVRGNQADNGYALSFGASDARYFAEKGIPAIVTRPDGGGMHSDSEWIDEAGLYQFYECVQKYVDCIALSPLDSEPSTGYTKDKLPETVTGQASPKSEPRP